MENTNNYSQLDFTLPHDVVTLPSKGKYYPSGKKTLKVGYLTAADENMLMSSSNDNIVQKLLQTKIYEPDFRPTELLEGDAEAVLIFLRNTSFGADYSFLLVDPKTKKEFEITIRLDELDIIEPEILPNDKGLFSLVLPKSGLNVECRLLTMGDLSELTALESLYPKGVIAPTVTKRLEKTIVSIDGITNPEEIAKTIMNLPIMDSKHIRNTMKKCEPRINLNRVVTAPSGEKVNIRVAFGAEFFRPFF
jgi:hypothetical protein